MSSLSDAHRLFNDPMVTQHGSHMVMSGVHRPIVTQTLNVDTRFCVPVGTASASASASSATLSRGGFYYSLADKINNVKSIEITSVQLTHSWFNFSAELGNTIFLISTDPSFASSTTTAMVQINDGQYNTVADLVDAINTALGVAATNYPSGPASYLTVAYTQPITADIYYITMTNSSSSTENNIYIRFLPQFGSSTTAQPLRQMIGWKMGFRNAEYTVAPNTTITGEAWAKIGGPEYGFLTLDTLQQSVSTNACSGILAQTNASAIAAKNIVAKIPFAVTYYGDDFLCYPEAGLIAEKLTFHPPGGASIQKLQFRLTDEFGQDINLQQMHFSFTCRIEHEQY